MTSLLTFDNSYARLPQQFYEKVRPAPVSKPGLIKFNDRLATDLNLRLGDASAQEIADIFSGNKILPGSEPLAMAYAGHQFGNFVPRLGDGRAVLLGEVVAADGKRLDMQLKGSGLTPFSRGADGRSPLGPVLREYLVSEAMYALGIPTTLSLAAVASGDIVRRQTPLPGAVLTRMAQSHIRIGTFEYFAARNDMASVKRLADYVIERLYPELLDEADPYTAMYRTITERQARLVAAWMGVGFIHGVMNTDNMAVSGETIDYGPCAFMDTYRHNAVFSSIDVYGRYAYNNQPRIAQWNLLQLAKALLPLFDTDEAKAADKAEEILNGFIHVYQKAWIENMGRKLGLQNAREEDVELITSLLGIMEQQDVDFTLTFRALCHVAQDESNAALSEIMKADNGIWLSRWRARLAEEPMEAGDRLALMERANPAYIPRNHRVEQAIAAALEGDYKVFEQLLEVLAAPYQDRPEFKDYMLPPEPDERITRTFCGT